MTRSLSYYLRNFDDRRKSNALSILLSVSSHLFRKQSEKIEQNNKSIIFFSRMGQGSIINAQQFPMLDKIGKIMRIPSQISLLISSCPINLALGLSGILICGSM